MNYLTQLGEKLGFPKIRSRASEVNYVLFDFQPEDPADKEVIDKASTNLFYYQIGGAALGLSLSLSLRRYLPTAFEDISLKRCLIDTFLVLGGYSLCSYLGMDIALENTKNLRKNLILQKHQGYLNHLFEKYQANQSVYSSERELFTEVLKDEEYDEWIKQFKPTQSF